MTAPRHLARDGRPGSAERFGPLVARLRVVGVLTLGIAAMGATAIVGCGSGRMPSTPADSDAVEDATSAGPLTIGSPAPKLDIEHWYGLGDDASEADRTVTFDGRVTLVEFWATWCGPCVASMPHLVELQDRLGEEGLRIVSISDEDQETVNAFLDRSVRRWRGDGDPPTYREFTSAYSLTSDPDRSTHRAYMEAAGQGGIPTAFLVGPTGIVEWVGHPMRADGPIEQLLAGSWDRDAFAAEFGREQEREIAKQDAIRLMQTGDIEAIEAKLEELAASEDQELVRFVEQVLPAVRTQWFFMAATNDTEKALAQFPAALDRLGDDHVAVNALTWQVYQAAQLGVIDDEATIRLAAERTEAVLAEDESKASLLDTIAHLYHALGDRERAIAFQSRAAAVPEMPDQLRPSVEEFLAQLLAEAEAEAGPVGDESQVEEPTEQEAAITEGGPTEDEPTTETDGPTLNPPADEAAEAQPESDSEPESESDEPQPQPESSADDTEDGPSDTDTSEVEAPDAGGTADEPVIEAPDTAGAT